jgi:hypothetical protein
MAIMDYQFELSDAQSIASTSGSTTTGETVVDLYTGEDTWNGTLINRIGEGNKLVFNCRVETAVAPTTSTVQVLLKNSAAETMGSATTLVDVTGAAGTMVAGYDIVRQSVPATQILRYLRCDYTIGGATTTAGTVNTWIGLDDHSDLPS